MAAAKKPRAGKEPPKTNVPQGTCNETWWAEPTDEQAAKALVAWSDDCIRSNAYRACRSYRYASLFEGFTLTNLSGFGAELTNDQVFDGLNVPVIRNKCRRLVFTFINKAFANDNPVPQFTTKGADFEQELAAENMDDAVCAEFDQEQGGFSDIHELWRHGGTIASSATGRCYVFAYPGEEKVEAELDDSLCVGIVKDGQYGPIQTLSRSTWRDPEGLAAKHPEHRAAILANIEDRSAPIVAGTAVMKDGLDSHANRYVARRREVRVIQGWRVRIGDKTGRRIYCLKDGTILFKSEWKKTKPPCAVWDFEKELSCEGGTPLTHTIYRMSMRQNEITQEMDFSQHESPQVTYLTQKGTAEASSVSAQIKQSQAVKVVEIDGNLDKGVRVVETPGLAKNSLQLEQIYDNAQHEDTGIAKNQTSGSGQPGTTSGIQESLRASYLTENFADQTRRLVRARAVDTARIFVWALEEMVENKGSKFERFVGSGRKRMLSAKDLDLDLNKYVLQIKPASDEKDSPKTRLQKAEQLLKDPAAAFTGSDMVKMWTTYDVKSLTDSVYVVQEWTEEQNERWLKSSKREIGADAFYQSPPKWFRSEGFKVALGITMKAYLQAKQQGAPPDRLKLFEKFMDECVELIEAEERRMAQNAGNSRGAAVQAPPGALPPAQAQV